jgi:hypothetical protein
VRALLSISISELIHLCNLRVCAASPINNVLHLSVRHQNRRSKRIYLLVATDPWESRQLVKRSYRPHLKFQLASSRFELQLPVYLGRLGRQTVSKDVSCFVESFAFHTMAEDNVKDLAIDNLTFVRFLSYQLQWISELLVAGIRLKIVDHVNTLLKIVLFSTFPKRLSQDFSWIESQVKF